VPTVITDPNQVRAALEAATPAPPSLRVLLADPAHFTVESVINPWMQNADGSLNSIDHERMLNQWGELKTTLQRIGLEVHVIEGAQGLPDFCFAANQTLPFTDADGKPAVILSHMRSETRAPEVPHYERWFAAQGYSVHRLPAEVQPFEGCGDAIRHFGRRALWGGVGPRTHADAWAHVARITGMPVFPLNLVDERFYHLDTCLCVLNATTALYFPAAFDAESLERLNAGFPNLIAVDDRAAETFACNAWCPDGRHLIVQAGTGIKASGFEVVEVETGEFMKSGGSVFCLKQELP